LKLGDIHVKIPGLNYNVDPDQIFADIDGQQHTKTVAGSAYQVAKAIKYAMNSEKKPV